MFDGSDCELFTIEDVAKTGHEEAATSEDTKKTAYVKRGKSSKHRNIRVSSKHKGNGNTLSDNSAKEGFVLEIPEMALRIVGLLLLVLVLFFVVRGVFRYVGEKREEAREDMVWEARKLIETESDARLVGYLRLKEVKYESHKLLLTYDRNMPVEDNETVNDTTVVGEFQSLVILSPDRWREAFRHLEEAEVDLVVVYRNVIKHPSYNFGHEKLAEELLGTEARQSGLVLFEQLKCAEIMKYAKIHFRGDVLFTADSVHVDKQFVSLCMSYDDKKASLSDPILDSTLVYPHYIDAVGDMGSILDGMRTVCTLTNRGFAFVYTARHSRKVNRVSWSTDRAAEAFETYDSGLWHDGKETNRIRTVIKRQRK